MGFLVEVLTSNSCDNIHYTADTLRIAYRHLALRAKQNSVWEKLTQCGRS